MEELLRLPPVINPPLMNAAGSLGFSPYLRAPLDWPAFGAFVTNPISARPRKPARMPRWKTYPGGALLHTGYPNPGFRRVVKDHAAGWAAAPLPVIVHLLAGRADEISRQVIELETLENILAVEIGFPEESDPSEVREVIQAGLGELPLIARLSLIGPFSLARAALDAGAAAVSLAPPRGVLPAGDGMMRGRVLGPGVLPQTLKVVQTLAEMEIPVIAAGGFYSPEDVEAGLAAGALAVQLDASLWRGDWFMKVNADTGD